MAEKSYLWTTGGAGDGASTYTRADWLYIAEILASCHGHEGVGPSYLNACAGSVPGTNTFRIATGGAVVDGKPYHNTSNKDVTIPSAVGGGNTRIDRIVLRADWTAQTVRVTRIAGTDAASPTPPNYTKSSQSTYDILLYQVLVDTSGNVSIELDEREFGLIGYEDMDDGAGSEVDADKLDGQHGSYYAPATKGVTNGDSHDHSGGDGAAIPTGGLANDCIDDTKCGNRVPQFYRRQGGNSSNWGTKGTTTYTPGATRIQAGAYPATLTASTASNEFTITFPVAFSYTPIVVASFCLWGTEGDPDETRMILASDLNNNNFQVTLTRKTYSVERQYVVNWIAIGPE